MTILFLGNTPADFGAVDASNVTTTTGRDTAYSPNSINGRNTSNFMINLPASTGAIWLHFRFAATSVSGTGSAGLIFTDASANIIAEVVRNTNTSNLYARVYGSTPVNGATGSLTANAVNFVDVKLSVGSSGGSITMELYINGVLASTATATNSGTVKGQPVQISYVNQGFAGNNDAYLSEVIVTSEESTIGARLATLLPSSAGAFADMTGTVASLADYDSLTGVVSDAAAERFNAIMSAYGGAASPASIRGVFLKSHATQSGGAPTKLAHSLRLGSTNYDGTPQTVVSGAPILTEWATNPNTGVAWTTAALAALEGGLLSAA